MARSFEPLGWLNDAGDQKFPTWRRAKPGFDGQDGTGDCVGKPRALADTVGNANRCGMLGQFRLRIAKRIGHTHLALSRSFEDGREAPHFYGQCGMAIYKLFCASGSDLPESGKAAIAHRNLKQAGLLDFVDLRLGDTVQTLAAESDPIDFVLNDIHPPVALPVLKQLAPHLRPGTLTLCGNAALFPADYADYLKWIPDPANGFCSPRLPMRIAGEMSLEN